MTSPNSGNPDDKLIRADRRGRLLVPAEQRAAILKAFDESSLSAIAFCRQHGLSYSTFATWIQKRRREQAPGSGDPAVPHPAFAEVVIDEGKAIPKTIPPLRVILRSGVSFEVVSADQVPLAAGLIQSIASLRSC
ncbi:IS66 family insertion sequence element accessory protein TnpA [Luteolibacter luteus]|uniref:Transposase n=1 Tax=Luteolibacter luteus TaxID=2728835 RepID=A0A858REV9_9BACT|nr:transposase [Luteolibacter luteus]QJE95265.1 transposase [Luteolibacter luteus]